MAKYLFLGGSRDGEFMRVRPGRGRIEVPVYIGGKVSPLDRAIKLNDTFPIEVYIKVNAPTDSGPKVVFVPEGTKVTELQQLINRPVHEMIK